MSAWPIRKVGRLISMCGNVLPKHQQCVLKIFPLLKAYLAENHSGKNQNFLEASYVMAITVMFIHDHYSAWSSWRPFLDILSFMIEGSWTNWTHFALLCIICVDTLNIRFLKKICASYFPKMNYSIVLNAILHQILDIIDYSVYYYLMCQEDRKSANLTLIWQWLQCGFQFQRS